MDVDWLHKSEQPGPDQILTVHNNLQYTAQNGCKDPLKWAAL